MRPDRSNLPTYSAVWFPPRRRSNPTGQKEAVCELFHFGAEAMSWAQDRVKERGGGAVAFSAEAGSVVLLGRFGKLPGELQRELAGNAIALDPSFAGLSTASGRLQNGR
jgi:hypothetical protein